MRILLVLAAAISAAACGTVPNATTTARPLTEHAAAASLSTVPSADPRPSPSLSPSRTPNSLTSAPIAAAARSMQEFTFSLIPVADAMAAGAVMVRPGSGGYTITVIARGLPAKSQHAVHLHAGQCPSAGFHLRVLGSLTASAAGTGQLASFVPGRYVGNGLFVIVYAGRLPGALGACANLAGMA